MILLLLSCGSPTNANNNTSADTTVSAAQAALVAYDTTLPKGKAIDSVICREQGTVSYALYLPSHYTPSKAFPCIFFFDAHARGSLPVKTYKAIAEQYGFVLVGSNASKNGIDWPTNEQSAKTVMNDVRSRINIDAHSIYTSGFSGGSRVASGVAVQDGRIAGVIGCAAGFPATQQQPQGKFDYFGLVGNYDFNLGEMLHWDGTLAQNGFTHQLLTFDGKHDWPPVADFRTALLWMQVNAMKENIQAKNDTLAAALKADYTKRIARAHTAHDLITEHNLLDGTIRTLDGLIDVSTQKTQLSILSTSTDYKNAVSLQAQLQQQEGAQQQELAKGFATKDEKGRTDEINALKHSIASAKTQQESQMYRRLLNYMGLVGYMNTDHALNTGDLANAESYLKAFKLADPKNPDCFYLSAVFYLKKGDTKQALISMGEAAKLGYSDVLQLTTLPDFSSLQTNAEFKKTLEKVRKNNLSE